MQPELSNASPRIAVVGAGPAGLVAAIAARRLGLEVTVFEQADDFRRVGGGILIHSNGQRVLHALSLLDSFTPQLRFGTVIETSTPAGQVLTRSDLSTLDIPFNRAAIVMRYQLQEHLLEAAQDEGIVVHFGHRCARVEVGPDEAVLHFENGQSASFDVVIAADGINSRVREGIGIPFEKRAVGEGWLRGVAQRHEADSTLREIWGDDGRRFGIGPLLGDYTYFYCRVPLGQWEDIREHRLEEWIDSWRPFGSRVMDILHAVPDWTLVNYSELHEIIAPRWHQPPVFLVGDAAHAMTPNLGQGANSAMVGALVLVQLLAQAAQQGALNRASLEQVGTRYTAIRHAFVTRLQNTARQSGQLANWTAPPARRLRNTLMRFTSQSSKLSHNMLLLAAGYNEAEEGFFGGR